MTTGKSAPFRNGQAIDAGTIPVLPVAIFRDEVLRAVADGQRLVTLFGQPIASGKARLHAVLADDAAHLLYAVAADARDRYPALTPECPQAHLFEREVYEQLGIVPEWHPWLKPVRAHDFGAGEKTAHPFFAMTGEEVHEVAVGPVHAGVIEPGHFRFQCHGEIVHHLEIHLGYQHRGVEEALAGGPHKRTVLQMETVAGDTSIGHGTAYCLALEALGGIEGSPRAQALRAIALEMERLANHVGDIGALSNDLGFLPTAAFCGRLRGEFLNMTALVCGSRLGRGLVRPGGVAFDMDGRMAEELLKRLATAERDVTGAVDLFFATDSVMGRLEGTGPVTAETCRDLGVVGLAARASGLPRDVRADHPVGWRRSAQVPVAVVETGDVYARALVRKLEIEHSIAFVRAELQAMPPGTVLYPCPAPRPRQFVVAMTEGWRGEVAHAVLTNAEGRFARYKLTDPSFHNWPALAMALRGQQISDFPLCNKSFNLSYCGFDL